MKTICEACESKPVEVIEESEDEQQPYYLCKECFYRLENLALRPMEWYRLAVIHSTHKYYLHDDFYEEDGEATQPNIDMEDEEELVAPTFMQVKDNVESLLDYSYTRWWLEEEVIEALKQFDPTTLLDFIRIRFDQTVNVEIKTRLYGIVGEVLQDKASQWIREQWENVDEEFLVEISAATALCLPLEEGYHLVTYALKSLENKPKPRIYLDCLYRFRSPLVLDFIEKEIEGFDEAWGTLAASSVPTWERMEQWLQAGRPLSLIALDAMCHCAPKSNNRVIAKIKPKIIHSPSSEKITKVLNEYAQKDHVHRVKRDVTFILEHIESIFIK